MDQSMSGVAECYKCHPGPNTQCLRGAMSQRHGLVCQDCHGSTHADFPAREAADNANSIALQGHSGVIGDCTVCHGVTPTGAGPHGSTVAGVEPGVLQGATPLRRYPNPVHAGCAFTVDARPGESGRLLLYDAQGRIVQMLTTTRAGLHGTLDWDGRDRRGNHVAAGTYFARWQQGDRVAATRLTVIR
jgi:hypothetical protein